MQQNQTNVPNTSPEQQFPYGMMPPKKPPYKKWWFWVLIVLAWMIIIGIARGIKKNDIKEIAPATDNAVTQDARKTGTEENNNTGKGKTTLQEQVLWENEACKITALSYESDTIWGDSVKVLAENKSDKTLHIGCDALIVNDYMITDLFVCELAAGKKSNESVSLMSSELNAAGIENVGKIELYFYYYKGDSFTDRVKSDCITIKTSHYDDMDTTPNDTGTELYNENGVRIVGKYVNENSFWGAAMLLYIENNSGKNITVTSEELSVNGYMVTEYFYATVYDGKRIIDDLTLSGSDLENNGIETIDEIELKFVIREENNYVKAVKTDPITFKVN